MIVPMKKIAILVQAKDSEPAIDKLRTLGVVHVEHQQLPKGANVSALTDELALIEQAAGILSRDEFLRQDTAESLDLSDWEFTARHIIDLHNRLSQLQDYALTLKNRIGYWQNWGDFDPQAMDALRKKGVYLGLYQIPVREIENLPAAVVAKKLSVVAGVANCLLICQGPIEVPYKEISLPQMRLAAMRERLSEDKRMLDYLKDEICKATRYRQAFLRLKRSLEEELEFHQALSGMGEAGALMYLTGYIPFDAVGSLEQTAKYEQWGIKISDPSDQDQVPTLIRNPRWVSMIKPVFKLIGVIPGYRELDISLWFLLFFSIFFGMLIGDAGIGMIFIALTFWAQRRWARKVKDRSIFTLFYLSSACAITWGALSGTFFGQEWLGQSVRPLLPVLRNDKNIQALCFFLGATHLSIAHSWRAIVKLPSLAALSEAGWILILWGAFFLAQMLILGEAFPVFAKWFFVIGAGLVVFFTSPSKNLLKGVGTGLGSLLLNLVNSFTDIVSYIRLFAVGLATVAIADAFNKMAMEVGFQSVASALITSLILFIGHALNILLAPLSVLVHGVRLNVLEFCNHIDIKWSGFAYRPLKKQVNNS